MQGISPKGMPPFVDREPQSKVVIGLGYGDEGKGMAVAHETLRALAHGLRVVNVRFNGGPQAAHNVRVMGSGDTVLHHTHSQFGSGSMFGALTVLTSGMLVDPFAIASEASHLSMLTERDVIRSLLIDSECPVILPMHVEANHAIERKQRHGSTGRGVGVARAYEADAKAGKVDASLLPTVASLLDPDELYEKMRALRSWIWERYEVAVEDVDLDEARVISIGMRRLMRLGLGVFKDMDITLRQLIEDDEHFCVIFEGSQGVMLDERFGYFPHVTYGDMSAAGAFRAADRILPVMGVTRTYHTRHGNGPLKSEGSASIPEDDNVTNEWAGAFRTGLLMMDELYHASSCVPVSEVAVSCVDKYPGEYLGCDGSKVSADIGNLFNEVEDMCSAPVTVFGCGNFVQGWHDRKGN